MEKPPGHSIESAYAGRRLPPAWQRRGEQTARVARSGAFLVARSSQRAGRVAVHAARETVRPEASFRGAAKTLLIAFTLLVVVGSSHTNATSLSAPLPVSAPIVVEAPEIPEGDLLPDGCPRDGSVEPLDLRDPIAQERILAPFFTTLGIERSEALDLALLTWVRAEGWDHGVLYNNNPLAMKVRGEGICGRWNSAGVTIIATPERGAELAAIRLLRPANRIYGYDRIVEALHTGNPARFLQAVAASDWNAPSFYGCAKGRFTYLGDLWADLDPKRAKPLRCR